MEQPKHVVFGSETEEGDSVDYDVEVEKAADTNDKEDEFKKVCASNSQSSCFCLHVVFWTHDSQGC